MQPNFTIENNYNNKICAGIDEAGRGPLAGPVVAACAILNQDDYPLEINDSKKLSAKKRHHIFNILQEKAKFGVGIVNNDVIDKINILQATKLAMFEAMIDLQRKHKIYPEVILVDGNFIPFDKQKQISEIKPIIKGDQKSLSIAAASIIAKEVRDKIMQDLHNKYPDFGFDKHAGYGTKLHIAKLHEFGPSLVHRKSFEPIKSKIKC